MHRIAKAGYAALLLVMTATQIRADALDALDNACGAALANLDCLHIASSFPEALGGAVGVLEAIKSQMSGADDCRNKLSGNVPLVKEALKYIDLPGFPVGELMRCSCNVAYSQATCTGEIGKVASDLWEGVKG